MSAASWLSIEQRARVVTLLKQGLGVGAIADDVGCNPKTVRRIARNSGVERNPFRPKIAWTAELDAMLTQMIAAGAHQEKMAAAAGCSAGAVRDRLKKLGLLRAKAAPAPEVPHDETQWQRTMRERGVSAERIVQGVHALPAGNPVSWPFGGSPAVGAP